MYYVLAFFGGLMCGFVFMAILAAAGNESQHERERELRRALIQCMKFYHDEEMVFPLKDVSEALKL